VTHDTDLLVAQRRALELASESMRLQRINYERGGIGLLDLLDAQRAYQQARLGDARAEAQRFQDTIRLFLAIGGGFRDIDPGDVRRVANSAGG
jgi:outer membrane protein TolC